MQFLKKYLPTHHTVKNSEHFRWIRHWLSDPRLWHLNRSAVAMGTAVGLFAAVIPLPFQMLLAVIFAIILRGNIPVAIAMTWVTNPFTLIPMIWLIYTVGALMTGEKSSAANDFRAFHFSWTQLPDFWQHLQLWLTALGKNFFIGLPFVALGLAFLGYLLIQLLWRAYIRLQIYARRKRYAK